MLFASASGRLLGSASLGAGTSANHFTVCHLPNETTCGLRTPCRGATASHKNSAEETSFRMARILRTEGQVNKTTFEASTKDGLRPVITHPVIIVRLVETYGANHAQHRYSGLQRGEAARSHARPRAPVCLAPELECGSSSGKRRLAGCDTRHRFEICGAQSRAAVGGQSREPRQGLQRSQRRAARPRRVHYLHRC